MTDLFLERRSDDPREQERLARVRAAYERSIENAQHREANRQQLIRRRYSKCSPK
jgi:hypothetical protein